MCVASVLYLSRKAQAGLMPRKVINLNEDDKILLLKGIRFS
jgi:hypothetical protein